MRELSLFTGAGGGILGSKLLGWETVGYVELETYCQRVIRQRIEDGIFDNAPIFGDIRAFNSEGYASSYQGLVDVVTGGFPCQPFSVAGKKLGADDPRNMWPETARCIRTIRPKYAFLENVPGLLSSGYFGTILSDIYEMGYDAKWCIVSAENTGALHKRERLWILMHARCEYGSKRARKSLQPKVEKTIRTKFKYLCENVSDSNELDEHNSGFRTGEIPQQQATCLQFNNIPDSNSTHGEEDKCSIGVEKERANIIFDSWWSVEPGMGRVVNGVANRTNRLKAIGNGQVPFSMALAWKILSEGIV